MNEVEEKNLFREIPFTNTIDDVFGTKQPSKQKSQPSNETNNKMIMTELYNLREIAYLYDNLDVFGPLVYSKCKTSDELKIEMDKLKKVLEHVVYHDGTITVTYDTDRDGRLFGQPHTIQMISGVVRNFLLEGETIADIDIVNSISAVLLSVCKKHDIECKTLTKYFNKRQSIHYR
jgi:hypothetical protein